MIAHVAEFNAPAEVLETIGMQGFRDRVLPVLAALAGYEGNLTLLDRQNNKLLGITLWDTAENGQRAAARLEQERETGVEEMTANSPAPTFYEVLSR